MKISKKDRRVRRAAKSRAHIRDLAGSHRLPGFDEIRVPGQGRLARRIEREKNGVPLSAAVVKQVDEVAKSLGITPLSARA